VNSGFRDAKEARQLGRPRLSYLEHSRFDLTLTNKWNNCVKNATLDRIESRMS
jgi:hypothetical protein